MTQSPSTKFLPYGICGLAGVSLLFLPSVISLPQSLNQAQDTARLQAAEQLQREAILEQSKTSELLRTKQIAPNSRTLFVDGYTFNTKTAPKLSKEVLNRYPASMTVAVHDTTGYCIGQVKNKKLYFRIQFPDVCEFVPQATRN